MRAELEEVVTTTTMKMEEPVIAYTGGRFRDLGNGIVEDTVTGVMWQQDAGGQKMKWDEAQNYIRAVRTGGLTGGRLPTKEELESLLDYAISSGIENKFDQFFNKIGFRNVQSGYYWSSTICKGFPNCGWSVSLYYGIEFDYDKSYFSYYAWPVRAGQ